MPPLSVVYLSGIFEGVDWLGGIITIVSMVFGGMILRTAVFILQYFKPTDKD